MSRVLESKHKGNESLREAGIRTLLVDDDPDLVEISFEMLEMAGCNVTTALHPSEAISQIKEGQHFDLLFTDYRFPGFVTGVELADEAVTYLPDLKVIIATGMDVQTVEEASKPEYVYIAKPFNTSRLKEVVSGLFKL